jgi:cell shape-determining protein MreD
MLSTYLYLHYYIIRQYFDWSDAILLIANSFLYSWLITWLSFMLLHYVFAATGGIKRYFVKRALWADKIFK